MDNAVEEDNVPLNQMFPIVVEERVPSISRTFVGLGRPSLPTRNRPPIHYGPTMEHAISGTSMNRNTNVGPAYGFGNPLT
jgi:hypothetical protein